MAKALKKTNIAPTSDIFVYIGPSVRGIIAHGSIFRGTREEVLTLNSPALAFCPKIERLIVADNEIMSAKKKIKEGGNSLSIAYGAVTNKITGKE